MAFEVNFMVIWRHAHFLSILRTFIFLHDLLSHAEMLIPIFTHTHTHTSLHLSLLAQGTISKISNPLA